MKLKLLKITQSTVDSLGRRVLTMFNGNVNTVTTVQYGPYGEDSSPIKDSIGIYAPTQMDGKEVCVGIMNKNAKAEPGERRLYCTDENGNFKFNIWLKADGTALQGDSDVPANYTNFAVKYNESKSELDALKKTVNDLITAFNQHSHLDPVSGALPPPTAVLNVIPVLPNASVFANIKNDKIKYNV